MQIVHQATFKFDKNLSEIVVCYSMFDYYFVDVLSSDGEADDNSPNRINYIKTKSFLAAEKVYYEKLSDLNKKMEGEEDELLNLSAVADDEQLHEN